MSNWCEKCQKRIRKETGLDLVRRDESGKVSFCSLGCLKDWLVNKECV